MKAINLNTLIDAYEKLTKEGRVSYLSFYGIELAEKGKNEGLKEKELECIKSFKSQFDTGNRLAYLLDNFFVGYKIPQIGKEFDLLRINDQNIVNIELKSEAEEEKVLKQLKRNSYYLKFLNKKVLLFTYVQESNTLYMLNDDESNLVTIDFDFLSKELLKDNGEIEDIDKLFNPSNYLISPFNSTQQFMQNEYFLTEHQEEIKYNILKATESHKAEFMALTGAAGTGKTLLTYHIAKELRNKEKKILIVHCAQLNEGQYVLQKEYGWDICMAKDIRDKKLADFDVVIVDEAQRAKQEQFDKLKEVVEQNNIKCIFSYDEKQYLNKGEKNRNVSNQISEILTQGIFKLTEKIRTNKEIASFIKPLFDSHEPIKHSEYFNINLYYCSDKKDVISLSKYLKSKGWKVPKYTPGINSKFKYENYGLENEESAHAVIGQEFDRVVAIIDETFEYDVKEQLTASSYYYFQRQMLYQILTRTRLKLFVIILNNEVMLKRCLEILGK